MMQYLMNVEEFCKRLSSRIQDDLNRGEDHELKSYPVRFDEYLMSNEQVAIPGWERSFELEPDEQVDKYLENEEFDGYTQHQFLNLLKDDVAKFFINMNVFPVNMMTFFDHWYVFRAWSEVGTSEEYVYYGPRGKEEQVMYTPGYQFNVNAGRGSEGEVILPKLYEKRWMNRNGVEQIAELNDLEKVEVLRYDDGAVYVRVLSTGQEGYLG